MSSNKHKKRKKSPNHWKEDVILSEEDIDEHWTVNSSDSDHEDINEGKRLTSLVRKSYVQHLHGTLEKNFEEWKKSVKDSNSNFNIQKWVSVLEQKALRSCMVAELYQKTMLQMISDIKKITQKSKLYISIDTVNKLNHLLPLDKETQSEIEEKKVKKFSVETQTGKNYVSLLDFPLPKIEPSAVSPVIRGQPIPTIDQIRDCIAKVTPVPRSNKTNDQLLSVDLSNLPYNPLIKFSPHENTKTIKSLLPSEKCLASLTTNITNSVSDKVEQPLLNNIPTMVPPPTLISNSSISKMLESTSNGKDANKSQIAALKPLSLFETNFGEVGSNNTSRDDILFDLQSEFSNPSEIQDKNNKSDLEIALNLNNKSDPLFDMLTQMEFGATPEIPKNTVKSLYSRKRKASTSIDECNNSNTESKQPKDCLDARLTAMGLLHDDNDRDEISVELKQKRSNWSLEFVAQSCNLTRIMNSLHPKQKKKVLAKFEKLFGSLNESETELNAENITICRKRIASVVVAELTPLYQAKRIGSKKLFKYLAKHATTSLMQQSYAPETRIIRRYVEELFIGNRDIESEADILF